MRTIRITLAVLLLMSMTAHPAFVQDGKAAGGGDQQTGGGKGRGTVVASGLANPRRIVAMTDGTLYSAETGTSGDEAVTPPAPYPQSTLGSSGRVTRVAPDGTKTTLVGDLPSCSLGGNDAAFVLGPHGLVSTDGALWLASGVAAAAVLRIDPKTGATRQMADLAAFEQENNPGGYEVVSNPYGLAVGPDGEFYVAGAGANDLLRVDPDSGRVTLVSAFPGLPGREPNQLRGGKRERDPVPSGVTVGPDGRLYVALLTGWPIVPGTSTVLRVSSDGTTSEVVGGLTAVTGVAFGPDGRLYVTEFGAFEKEEEANRGRILRVMNDGTTQVVADSLPSPNFPTFDARGNLYVSIASNTEPTAGAQGQVVRFDRVAAPGMPDTGAGGARRTPNSLTLVLGLTAMGGISVLLVCRGRMLSGRGS